jgi:DnaJ-class molecular chaperone
MADKKGYYKELGLEKTATVEEIKQTYRKMALVPLLSSILH